MGKKSSNVPKPDPRLVEAQIRSMGYQDDAVQRVVSLMEEQQAANDELMPLQRDALQFSLDAGKTAFDQTQSDRSWLLGRREALTGLQDSMVAEAKAFNGPAEEARRASAAEAQVGQALANEREASTRSLATMGVMPDSGRAGAVLRKAGIEGARLGVAAANDARLQARNEGRALTDRASNSLAGYPSAAMAATGAGAGIGAGQVSTANQGAGGINAGYGAMTGAAQAAGGIAGGLGSNATGMWNSQAQYKLAADQAAGADLGGIGSLLGGAARLYTAFGGSAREYKEDIERIGTHPRLGIPVYRYRYKAPYRARWGHGMRVGVMIDELAPVMPQAISRTPDGYRVVNYSML